MNGFHQWQRVGFSLFVLYITEIKSNQFFWGADLSSKCQLWEEFQHGSQKL
ncbi:MAG: hypothetical protein M0036_26920 [Desulfobacteraceae bacterium]|nr:hypothetical protein [Desulfobacteraceae bacterium]